MRMPQAISQIRFRTMAVMVAFVMLASEAAYAANWATEWTQILNNIQLIGMKINQAKQLYNEAEMIRNQVESLKSIQGYQGSWQTVDQLLNQIESLRQRSDSTWNQVNGMYQRTRELYPDLAKNAGYGETVKALNEPVITISSGAIQSANERIERERREDAAVKELLRKSDEAVGQTQTLQVMNKLLAQLIEQMQTIREQNDWVRLQMASESIKRAEAENKAIKDADAIFHASKSPESTFKLNRDF